ncbi:MAG: LysM peptidoglycan-binding domain-containing protein [Candidatus Gastranaerophilales bacterium]|nr:LysM peptidoglycan-binding domain-containing protein [Candidatus Gastranaerophilales bacterium]
MRFGLMNLYPDAVQGTGATPAANQDYTLSKLPDDKKDQVNRSISQSVFSNYDGNKNEKVNYDEANSNSLFANAQKKLDYEAQLNNRVSDATAKTNIMNNVLGKFNATEVFNNLLKSGFGNIDAKKVDITNAEGDSAKLQQDVNAKAKELDGIVNKAVEDKIKTANEQLATKFNEAINKAIDNYKDNPEVNFNQNDVNNNTAALNGTGDGTVKGKEFDKAQNTDEFKATVYASYDGNKDESVKAKDGEIKIASIQEIIGNKLSNIGSDTNLAKAIQQDITATYNTEVESYSIDSGSKDVKGKTQTELKSNQDKAIAKLNDKVKSGQAKADKNLEKAITKAFDKAYDTNMKLDNAALAKKGGTIKGTSGEDSFSIVPDGNGNYSATLNGQPATYTPNANGGGTLTQTSDNTTVTLKLNNNGSVLSSSTTTTATPPSDGGTHTITTSGDSTIHSYTGGTNGDRSITTTGTGNDVKVTDLSFTPATPEGGEAQTPVTIKSNGDGQFEVIGTDGKPIEGATVTGGEDNKYEISVGGKKYTIEVNQDSSDFTAKEVEAASEKPAASITHKVKKGESFWKIAHQYVDAKGKPGNMNELAAANNMKISDTIHPNQELKLPEGWKKKS